MNRYQKITAVAVVTVSCTMLLAAFTPANALFRAEQQPAAAAFSKWDGQGQLLYFTAEEFTSRVSGEEDLSAIVLNTLPQQGALRLAGQTVGQGQAIPVEELSTLCFVPEIGAEDIHTHFDFRPVFSRSGAAEQAVRVSLNLSDTPNTAPIAVEQTFETYTDLSLLGNLKAVDPDGDACTFTVERQGKRGVVEITENGFRYIPTGKSGRDTFTVVATDCFGNRSQPAEITVRAIKRHDKEQFTYTDLQDSAAHYAALRLREAGVFSGETFGTEAFFRPEQPVSRAEFLTMAASVVRLAQPAAAVSTGMSDHEAIPAWAQGYVAAGILSGVVNGSADGAGNRVFRAEDGITRAEAAAILNRCLTLADDGREPAFADDGTVPAWARQAVVNCSVRGLLPTFADGTVRAGDVVTREDAAVMLYEMLQYGEK